MWTVNSSPESVDNLIKVWHNPIFTPGIFSGVGTQNDAARTEPVRPDRDPPHQKNLKTGPGAHFSEFKEGQPTLTKFN